VGVGRWSCPRIQRKLRGESGVEGEGADHVAGGYRGKQQSSGRMPVWWCKRETFEACGRFLVPPSLRSDRLARGTPSERQAWGSHGPVVAATGISKCRPADPQRSVLMAMATETSRGGSSRLRGGQAGSGVLLPSLPPWPPVYRCQSSIGGITNVLSYAGRPPAGCERTGVIASLQALDLTSKKCGSRRRFCP